MTLLLAVWLMPLRQALTLCRAGEDWVYLVAATASDYDQLNCRNTTHGLRSFEKNIHAPFGRHILMAMEALACYDAR